MSKILIITIIPSPYRVTLFNALAEHYGKNFKVLYCAANINNLQWELQHLRHSSKILKKRLFSYKGRNIFWNKNTWKEISNFKPDIIITTGFTPTMLIAILYARYNKIKHFINTDSWELPEKQLSIFHVLLRKVLFEKVDAFLPVSKKGEEMFIRNYGIKKENIFIVHYAIDVDKYNQNSNSAKEYDLLFVGQFIPRKMPLFFVEIIEKLVKYKTNLKILLLGMGELVEDTITKLKSSNVDYTYPGFVQPYELPALFAKSRIYLFPTLLDAWGVVANEAVSAGLPVITCNNAGCAGEIVINNYNGFVLPLTSDLWAEHILKLFTDESLYESFCKNSLKISEKFSIENAKNNFISAVNSAI